MIRITSLNQLKNWNNKPTKESPIAMEWLIEYFFELLDTKNNDIAFDLYNSFIEFTMICEKMNELKDAIYRVQLNIGWYADRGINDKNNLNYFYKLNNINQQI